jgi:hypothetical protein
MLPSSSLNATTTIGVVQRSLIELRRASSEAADYLPAYDQRQVENVCRPRPELPSFALIPTPLIPSHAFCGSSTRSSLHGMLEHQIPRVRL